MECPKCNKGTMIKVTTTSDTRVKEKKGIFHLVIGIITWPFRFVWRVLFGKKRENFHKKMVWNCRYCNNTVKAD